MPAHCRMRAYDRDLIRGGHYGQRPRVPHKQAEHMAAPTNAANVKKVLANSEPSTHGTKRTCRTALYMSAFGGKADIASVSQNVLGQNPAVSAIVRKRTLVSAFRSWRCKFDPWTPWIVPQPAIRLPRKDWLFRSNRAVLCPVRGAGCASGSCPAGFFAEVGLRWWRRWSPHNRRRSR